MLSENICIDPRTDFLANGNLIASSINRNQCAGVIFGIPGTMYLYYRLTVSPSAYSVYCPHLCVQVVA